MKKVLGGALIVLILLIGGCSMALLGGTGTTAGCASTGADATFVDKENLPADMQGYSAEQLSIAADVINVAATLKLPEHAAILGITAGLGESGLRNLGYGDDVNGVTNPNGSLTCSLGFLQQQWCLSGNPWGTKADVLTPANAAMSFLKRLSKVDSWDTIAPSLAIHRVQGNANPNHYAQYFNEAQTIYKAVSGSTTGFSCTPSGDWTSPVDLTTPGLMISDFMGPRPSWVIGYSYIHNGLDISMPEGTPIVAAASGTVIKTVTNQGSSNSGLGNRIEIDHGGGIITRYHHLRAGGVSVVEGQSVKAGEVIGSSGNSGTSTGAHLHFTIFTEGKVDTAFATEPVSFLRQKNIDMCSLPVWSGHSVKSAC